MISSEALQAFVQAASCGSFSAAARKLGKSQSTISTAIANLETDLGIALFDRGSRKPSLTEHGRVMLRRAEEVLAAHNRLERAANELAQGLESKLTIVLSDTYQSDRFERALSEFQDRYPDLELECLIAECDDLLAFIQQGRAQLGFVETQVIYPPEIDACAVAERTEMALFVAKHHPLAALPRVNRETLYAHRELRLATVLNSTSDSVAASGRSWSAPSYLMLLEMAEDGFGWAPIPRWLVERYGSGSLHELEANGWPRQIVVDAVSSRRFPLGPAGSWLLNKMTE
ncbi:LysR family transcriptional regulator [Pseudomonas sp. CrR25]|nr:LysR family transcriptional regulator [Pseudomonas sp. CrR25]